MPFKLVRTDITTMKVDAVVHSVSLESQGTDSAAYERAGAGRFPARKRKIGRIEEGEAEITSAFSLGVKYIIHTAGPMWQGGGCGETAKVRRCYENSLRLARKHGCKSIALPLICGGAAGYPQQEVLEIALSAISDFLDRTEMMVYLVFLESFALPGSLFREVEAYIRRHYGAKRPPEEAAVFQRGVSGPALGGRRKLSGPSGDKDFSGSPMVYGMRMAREAVPEELESQTLLQSRRQEKEARRSLEDAVAQIGETFQQRLLRLIDERSMTDVEVYKRANLDRKLFSKIRCNVRYRPKKMTAIALAVALRLNLDETKDLLSRAELALSPSSKFDLIIEYFIDREIYDIYTINLALFQHEEPLLGES